MIPNIKCIHCSNCCGPIIWFKPEEILIRDFLEKNKLKYTTFTKEQIKKNDMKCPYLKENKCIIYPVRPIVCRLQGNIDELVCKNNIDIKKLNIDEFNKIRREFFELLKKTNGLDVFYSNKMMERNNVI